MKKTHLKKVIYSLFYYLIVLTPILGCSTFDENAPIYINNERKKITAIDGNVYADPKKYLFNSKNKLPGNLVITNIKGLSDEQKLELNNIIIEHAEEVGLSIVPTQYADLYANYNSNQHYMSAQFDYAPGIDSSVFYYVWNIHDPQGGKVHFIKDEVGINNNPEKRATFVFPRNVLNKIAKNTVQKLSIWWARYSSAYPDRTMPPAFMAMPQSTQPYYYQQPAVNAQTAQPYYYQQPAVNTQTAQPNYYQQPAVSTQTAQPNINQNAAIPHGVPINNAKPNLAINSQSPQVATTQNQTPPKPVIQTDNNVVTNSIKRYKDPIINQDSRPAPIVFIANSIKGLDTKKTIAILRSFKQALGSHNILVTSSVNNAQFIITAEAHVKSISDTDNAIRLDWHIQQNSGEKIGLIQQKNTLSKHDMHFQWNTISRHASQDASIKVIELLND